jgi:membrane-bound inhibitor of C-type lysozyme
MRRFTAILLPLALLAACATPPSPPSPPLAGMTGPETAYLCADQATVYVTEHPGEDARAVLSDGKELRLPQFPSRSGFQYGTATHEFRGGGSTAVWTAPQHPPVACHQKQ